MSDQYLALAELTSLTKLVEVMNNWYMDSESITTGNAVIFDVNGDPLGRIAYNPNTDSYVWFVDYNDSSD